MIHHRGQYMCLIMHSDLHMCTLSGPSLHTNYTVLHLANILSLISHTVWGLLDGPKDHSMQRSCHSKHHSFRVKPLTSLHRQCQRTALILIKVNNKKKSSPAHLLSCSCSPSSSKWGFLLFIFYYPKFISRAGLRVTSRAPQCQENRLQNAGHKIRNRNNQNNI